MNHSRQIKHTPKTHILLASRRNTNTSQSSIIGHEATSCQEKLVGAAQVETASIVRISLQNGTVLCLTEIYRNSRQEIAKSSLHFSRYAMGQYLTEQIIG